MKSVNSLCLTAVALLALSSVSAMAATNAQKATPLALPGVSAHARFDDMGFAAALDRIIVPGGISGTLFLIDPKTNAVSRVAQITLPHKPQRGRDEGTTSAAYAHGYLFASDHADRSLAVVDVAHHRVVGHVKLASGSDFVRYVAPLNEVWVTEPHAHQIQIFRAAFSAKLPQLTAAGTIKVPGGPEALAIDAQSNRAYTNLWKSHTLAIDLKTRKIVDSFANTCHGSRGLALAHNYPLLFVGCKEGKAVALDLAMSGKVVASAPTGAGVDIIAWNPKLDHLYVPGARSATLTILALTIGYRLQKVRTIETARGAHCVATDGRTMAYVCDPLHGRVLAVHDAP